MKNTEEKQKSRKKSARAGIMRRRRLGKAGILILAVLVLAGGVGFFLMRHYIGKMNQVNTSTQSYIPQDEYLRLMREMYGSDWVPETKIPGGTDAKGMNTEDGGESESTSGGSPLVPTLPKKPAPGEKTGESEETKESRTDIPSYFPNGYLWDTAAPLDDEGLINVMLIGNDYLSSGIGFSDTMILCSINPDTHQVALTSFMRDMNLPMGDYGYNNLNHAYAIGGFSMLDNVLTDCFGLHIDGYASVGIDSLVDIINYMGGVDLYLTQAEADLINLGDSVNPADTPESEPSVPAETGKETAESSGDSTEESKAEESTAAESTAEAPSDGQTEAFDETESSASPAAEETTAESPAPAPETDAAEEETAVSTSDALQEPAEEQPGIPAETESAAAAPSTLTEGWNHLSGNQAVYYARIRSIDNDYKRTERQRTLLNALFEKVKHSGVISLMNMLNDILPLVSTTMSRSQIMNYAGQVLPFFASTSISSYRIPAEGSYYGDFLYGQYVMRVNQLLNLSYLKSILP